MVRWVEPNPTILHELEVLDSQFFSSEARGKLTDNSNRPFGGKSHMGEKLVK